MGILDSSFSVNGRHFTVTAQADSNLLDTLAGQDIHLPAACGGHGSCGLCRCRLRPTASGISLPEPGLRETPYLRPDELADGWRLACQQGLRAGMDIEVPPEILEARRFPARVAAIEDLSPGVRRVALEMPPGSCLGFEPGQWARLELPVGGVREHRAFSFAMAPEDISSAARIEFIIRKVPGGLVTSLVHERLAVGDDLAVIGPFGDFRLGGLAERPQIWVAGGTGLAPFVSRLRQLEAALSQGATGGGQIGGGPIRLLFSGHEPADLFLDAWLRGLAGAWPQFSYRPFVSEVPSGVAWSGAVGRLPAILRAELAEIKAEPPGIAAWDACIVGSSGFVEAGRALLRSGGVPDSRIHFDRFI